MAWPWIAAAARHVPWQTLLANAPVLADAARRLYKARAGRGPKTEGGDTLESLRAELAALQQQNAEQARLLEELARQMEDTASSIATLRARQWLALALAALAVAVALLAFFLGT